ncbi:MAG: PAS domain S-box protein, partial [Mariprofundaceae bacterium]|nr:PAS domain S-box protein [Mariprofundaceae bacterium]
MQMRTPSKTAADIVLDKPMSADEYECVRLEQIKLLFDVSPYLIASNALIAFLVAILQWDTVEHTSILIWLACMVVVVVFRFIIIYKFSLKKLTVEDVAHGEKLYMVTALLLGFTWGATGILFFPQGDIESQGLTVFILILLTGVVAARPMVVRGAFFTFLFCVMVPVIVQLILLGSDIALKMLVACIVYSIFLVIYANKSYQMHMKNILFQVRYLEHEEITQTSQYMSKKTAEILKMVAVGESVQDVCDEIIGLYEQCYDGLRCSVLALQGDRLLHISAPSLPKTYSEAVNGLQVGLNRGSCGTAAYLGQRVLVEDIANDEKWQAFKDIALSHGMRSRWSEPVLDAKGQVLGTLAMYHDELGLPSEQELYDLEAAARLVSIVMGREQREDSLRTLSQAIEQTGEGVMISNVSGLIEYVNPAFTYLTGYEASEIVGKPLSFLNKSKETEAFYKKLWSNVRCGEIYSAMVTEQRKDGCEYPARISAAPIFNGEDISHYVTIKQDMTEHETLEGQLRQAQKMEAVGTLVGGIAHDFNNILAGMTGNLYLAKRRSQALPDVVKGIENIEQLAMRGADLIQRLMTFARKDQVDIKKIKLEAIFSEAIQLLRTSIPENVDMHQDMLGSPLYIRGDSTQMHQVLMNLVNNAYDALEGKSNPSITIKLERFYPDADFMEAHPYFRSEYYAHLSVEDNGNGIPEAQVKHLFEPFFTTKEVGKGTGLGLSMVFGAVKRHEG